MEVVAFSSTESKKDEALKFGASWVDPKDFSE